MEPLNQNVRAAMERLEEAAYRAQTTSKQPRYGAKPAAVFGSFLKWYKRSEAEQVPVYAADSRARDAWLSKIWRLEPHLNGVVNSVVSIDKNRAWTLTGGRNQTNRYNTILRNAEDGDGWRYFMSKASEAFYTSDMGALTEVGRDMPGGPARAIYHVDSQRCKLTGDRNGPLEYYPAGGDMQTWAAGDYFRTTSMPATNEDFNGLGYCAVSRAWTLVQLMMAVYEHDLEKLGARAPKGLLLLQNISEQQWADAMKAREVDLSQRERDWFGGVAVLAQEGVDQVDAKLVALSQLPDGFNLEQFTQLLMYGIALCFAYDPIEFWPVAAGALGRGKETEIQHMKATGKGGLDFVLSFQDRLQRELPPTLLFEFEQRDVSGEMKDAEVAKAWADVFAVYASSGILDREEVRRLMVDQGIIPGDWTEAEESAQIDSGGEQRSQLLAQDAIWRCAFTQPTEPIVRRHFPTGRVEYLFGNGLELVYQHRSHPVAKAVFEEYADRVAREVRDWFTPPVFAIPAQRAEVPAGDDVLFSEDEVEITLEDVRRAVANGRKRVGRELSDLMLADVE